MAMLIPKLRLLRPVNFLFIKANGLNLYRWAIPFALSLVIYIPVCIYSENILPAQSVETLFQFLSSLPGFFIAALAAVATFGSKTLDGPLSNGGATLTTSQNGEVDSWSLSRRHFLSYLFGYLTFLCICIVSALLLLKISNPFQNWCESWYSCITAAVLVFLAMQLFVLTLLGLFYLCDRIHWPVNNK